MNDRQDLPGSSPDAAPEPALEAEEAEEEGEAGELHIEWAGFI